MSVLIKGMEMPTSCHMCVGGYGGFCFVAPAEADGICPDHGRADFCPLIPVPPHGRLIDADALFEEVYKVWGIEYDASECNTLMGFINDAPTVIPAEGET